MRSLRVVLGTQHLEDDHRVAYDLGVPRDRGTDDHAVRITDVIARDLNLEIATVEFAGFATQSANERDGEIGLKGRVTGCAAGHGDGASPVEFVALLLPFLPSEEFGERHRLPHGEVHG